MQLSFEAYRLFFHSGLHIGIREGALEGTESIIHSDTLFSAFINGYRLLYEGDRFDALARLLGTGQAPLRFSSAFPFVGNNYYLPMPRNHIPMDKHLKKVQFVERQTWQHLISGEDLQELASMDKARMLPPHDTTKADQEETMPWNVLNTPRVGLDRWNNHPGERYFYCSETHFQDKSGLYFLATYDNDRIRDEAHAVWRLMADEGLGGDRTVGKGLFAYPHPEQVCLETCDGAAGWISLSLYYPAANEISGLTDGYYDLIQRRGYVYSRGGRTLRRSPVSMFAEGSVFPLSSQRLGKLVNVTPARFALHAVYRSGLALGVPCVTKEKVS